MKCAVSDFDRTLYIDGCISAKNLNALVIGRQQETGLSLPQDAMSLQSVCFWRSIR